MIATSPSSGPSLIVTGSLRKGKYLVIIDGKDVHLTRREFLFLVDLVHSRMTRAAGYTSPPRDFEKNSLHQTIRRLRLAIDTSLGWVTGDTLVSHGAGSQYYLNIPIDGITVEPSFADLAPHHLPQKVVDDLMRSPSGIPPDTPPV